MILPAVWVDNVWLLTGIGAAAGVLSGLLGIGSALILVPALVLLLGYSQPSAQGTALAVMVPMALIGAWRYAVNPTVDLQTSKLVWIAAGACLGALVGASAATVISEALLRKIFAVFLLIVAVRMWLPPGAE